MAIKYEAYTWSGGRVTGVLETDSEDDAYDLLRQEELIPSSLTRIHPRRSLVQLAPSLFKPRSRDTIEFTRQIASLLKSGIPLRRALLVQRDQTRNPGLKEALRQVIQNVEGGGQFSDAVAQHPTVFSNFYVRLLKVGEATGTISPTLQQLAETLERRQAVQDKVRRALTYPAISLVVAAIAAFVLITFTVPSLVKLLKEFGGELPFATQLFIAISEFLQVYVVIIFGTVLGVSVLIGLSLRSTLGGGLRDALLLKVPVVGGILLSSNMFFLATTLVTLLKAGVPTIEALRLANQSQGNAILRAALGRVTSQASEGMKLGQAFTEQRVFPPLVSQAIVIGEMRGMLVDTLGGLASYYEQQTEKSIGSALELIQPAIMLVIAAIVGFVAVAVISGIYSTLGSVR